jgi:putative copper resistance protein D
MVEIVAVLARFCQYSAAVVLFGAPLFFLYALPAQGPGAGAGWARPRVVFQGAALLLLAGAVVGLAAQTATLTGDLAQAFQPAALWDLATGVGFGMAMALRAVLALGLLAATLALKPKRTLWLMMVGLSLVVLASFAWSGHGAADDGVSGWIHLGADLIHLAAAGVWLGALSAMAMIVASPALRRDRAAALALHDGLANFAGVGSGAVALLIVTGLINSWFLVGLGQAARLAASPYGLVLLAKLAVFAAMIVLAAVNRFVLTPRLKASLAAEAPDAALKALARSIGLETGAAACVLGLVSVLGILDPLSAS